MKLESLILAGMLDDGISPKFLHERLIHQEAPFLSYMARERMDIPEPLAIVTVLGEALRNGLVTCRVMSGTNAEAVAQLPPGPYNSDFLAFRIWFELTPEGEEQASKAFALIQLENSHSQPGS